MIFGKNVDIITWIIKNIYNSARNMMMKNFLISG